MSEINQAKRLREMMRFLVRKLGFLERGEASCCNITISQCHAIVEIGRAGNLSQNELAEILNLDTSTVSRSVDNLVKQGLVLRDNHPDDRRYMMLALTDRGDGIFREIESRMQAYFVDIIASIPAEKREQIIESLDYLSTAINGPRCC